MPVTPGGLTPHQIAAIANGVQTYGPAAQAAAAKIGRVFKSYRKRKSQFKMAVKRTREINKIGDPAGQSTSKKDGMISTSLLSADLNEIYNVEVTALERDIGATPAGQFRLNINSRDRGAAFISGIRIKQSWLNKAPNSIMVRWALISPKNNTVTSLTAGFFRAYQDSRDVDFSSVRTTLEKQTYPINRDKYRVFYEGKMYLGSSTVTGQTRVIDRERSNMGCMDRWFPINRQVRFNDDSDQACEDKIFFVWWTTPYMESSTVVVPALIETQSAVITHFRDPLEVLLNKAGMKAINKPRYKTKYANWGEKHPN